MGLVLASCGGPDNVGGVSGKVTLGGQPLPDATVTFTSLKEGGSSAMGKTDSGGNYSLRYTGGASGAEQGENKVTISTYDAGNPDSDPPRSAVPEKVPAKYNVKSQEKVEVKPGSNTIDFNLEPGPVIQPGANDDDDSTPAGKGKSAPGGKQKRPRSDAC